MLRVDGQVASIRSHQQRGGVVIVRLQIIVKHEMLYFPTGKIIRNDVDVTVSRGAIRATCVGHGARENLALPYRQ